MYQYRSGLLPYSFNNMFLVTRQVHSYGTSSSELFYLPQCRTNIRKFSISFQGPKFLTLLVLKFEMQQEPLPFAVRWMYSAYHKYIFFVFDFVFVFCFFVISLFFRLTMISTTAIDFSMCTYDNILFLLFNWGNPFLISLVTSLGLPRSPWEFK